MRSKPLIVLLLAGLLALCVPPRAAMAGDDAPDAREGKIEELERMLNELKEQVRQLKAEREAERAVVSENQETITRLADQVDGLNESWVMDSESWINKFTLGGYGEIHANFGEGAAPDQFDIHRLVLYLGYDFNDWIKFNLETEIEHAFVTDDSDGEIVIEQAYIDFLLSDPLNVRVGRILTPLGIINKKHEPPSFNGVERPAFARYIIATTWSSDGAGIFGSVTPSLKYEAYVVAGLDGSEFDAINGVRGGRIKERPSLNEPAFTGRLDYYPFATREAGYNQMLRLGLSTYYGGLDNGNKGNNPDINGEIGVVSADFEYSVSRFDFRGALAYEKIDDAREIGNGTASDIFGWYLEGAYHFWPDSWKKGKLERSDAVVFVRFDDFDTQYDVPSGIAEDPAGDRTEWTFGLTFYLTPNLVAKADYQIRDDDTGDDLAHLFNLGVGWQF